MLVTIHNRALLRGIVASAVALGGLSACSRSDRSEAARDTTQTGAAVVPADTQASGNTQPGTDTSAAADRVTGAAAPQIATPSPTSAPSQPTAEPKDSAAAGGRDVSGYHAMGHETDTSATATAGDTTAPEMAAAATDTTVGRDTVAVGDSAEVGKAGERLEPNAAGQQANADTAGAGAAESERIRPPEDSSESQVAVADTAGGVGAPTDTAASGYEPMARDTSTVLAQADTTGQVQSDTAFQAETDTAAIQVQADTTNQAQTELAVEGKADTVTVVGDSSSVNKPGPRAKEDTVSQKADSLAKYHEAERIRPPEDSTEILGNVTTPDRAEAEANETVEAVGDAHPEAVGAAAVASTGNIATGADAVALMTREGQPCRVEDSPEVQWDLAGSPATMNPCGSGTMTLPKVQTGEK